MQKRPPPRHNPGSPPDKAVAVQRRKPPEEDDAGPGHFGVQVSSQKNGALGGAIPGVDFPYLHWSGRLQRNAATKTSGR